LSDINVFHMAVPDECDQYVDACCRIRQVTRSHLYRLIINAVVAGQLVEAVLDDENNKRTRPRYYRRKKP
jgi:hypothetical protein